MDNRFDLTIIGGGPGGYAAAIRASRLGLRVALVEERELGGTCLNRGCIPTKSLLHSAELYRSVRTFAEFGISVENPGYDYKKISVKKDSVVKQLRSGVEALVKGSGCTVIYGRAVLRDKNTVDIRGREKRTISTGKIIIATGSRPSRPPIPGIDGDKILDSDMVLEMTSCPDKTVIIGGGVIGAEFATIFTSLGKKVTIVEMTDSLVPGVDSEISKLLRKSLESKGVMVFTGARVTSIESDKTAVCRFEKDGKEQKAEGDIIIAAIGRKPNSENLGLESTGIETEKGFIKVNERLETSVKGIYAIGDVTGKVLLAHAATAQGMAAAVNAAGGGSKMKYDIVPGCIYTSPEIAAVGLTESEAVKRGYKVKIGRFPVSANGKSMIMGDREGLVKIITDEQTGEILGTHIMGPRATDMIGEICVAMRLESTIEELSGTIHAHPTVSEIIMEAAHDAEGICIHKPAK